MAGNVFVFAFPCFLAASPVAAEETMVRAEGEHQGVREGKAERLVRVAILEEVASVRLTILAPCSLTDLATGKKIVNTDYFVFSIEEFFTKMRTYESCSTCD